MSHLHCHKGTCYYVNGKKEFGSPKNQIPWIKHLYDKWDSAIRRIGESMDNVWNDPKARSTIWQQLNEKYRNTSFRDFLIEQKWSQDEFELFSVVGFGVGGYGPMYPISFIEILRINVCRWDKEQLEIRESESLWNQQTLRDVPDRLDGHFTLMPVYLK